MDPNQYFTQIDTLHLKAFIFKRIGHQRTEKYFRLLSRFFTFKLSKSDFDKLCNRTLGRENISLHNLLIKSIIKNAHLAKYPVTNKRFGSQKARHTSVYHKKVHVLAEKTHALAQQSATELLSIGSRPPVDIASVEDGEEVEQASPGAQSKSPVTAPLGISNNLFGSRKSLHNGSLHNLLHDTCYNNGVLPDSRSLRARLDRMLKVDGINVSVDCANLLNYGLDVYLKRLIEPCLGLAASKPGNKNFQRFDGRIMPGTNGSIATTIFHRCKGLVNVSVPDFQAAMEINPKIAGEDRAVQFEKIFFSSLERNK